MGLLKNERFRTFYAPSICDDEQFSLAKPSVTQNRRLNILVLKFQVFFFSIISTFAQTVDIHEVVWIKGGPFPKICQKPAIITHLEKTIEQQYFNLFV